LLLGRQTNRQKHNKKMEEMDRSIGLVFSVPAGGRMRLWPC
jgi:hypothetical protein